MDTNLLKRLKWKWIINLTIINYESAKSRRGMWGGWGVYSEHFHLTFWPQEWPWKHFFSLGFLFSKTFLELRYFLVPSCLKPTEVNQAVQLLQGQHIHTHYGQKICCAVSPGTVRECRGNGESRHSTPEETVELWEQPTVRIAICSFVQRGTGKLPKLYKMTFNCPLLWTFLSRLR